MTDHLDNDAGRAAETSHEEDGAILLLFRDLWPRCFMAGCAVGPNYHRPAVQTPAAFRDLAENPQARAASGVLRGSSLVASFPGSATAGTYPHGPKAKLRSAIRDGAHQRRARPTCDHALQSLPAGARKRLFRRRERHELSQSKYNILGLTADAAFQLDLFGQLRRATEASRAQLLATEDAQQDGHIDAGERRGQ